MYKLALVLKPFTGYDTYIAGSYNGSTAAFEAVNLGSIPSPAAISQVRIFASRRASESLHAEGGATFLPRPLLSPRPHKSLFFREFL